MLFEIEGKKFKVDVLNRNKLSSSLIQQWSDLEERSVEGNAYLSPYFILPSIKYLTPNAEVIFVFITNVTGNTSILTGVGVFEYVRWTHRLPLPHFKAYRSPHSYLTGLLVDEEFLESTLSAFFTLFSKFERYSCGIEFINRTDSSKLAEQFEIAASRIDVPWVQYNRKRRAILIPEKSGSDCLNKVLSSKMKKSLRRHERLLSHSGEVRWNVVRGHEIELNCIDRFLSLEHMGWKGANGTSLLSNPAEESFFREMINGFAQHSRAFFTELSVNGRVIASTANLISSKMGYAFKLGWDSEFAAASPGMLNEVEFIKNASKLYPHLEYIDSGADEGSFIETLWVDRYTLASGFYATRPFAKPVAACFDFGRRMKYRLHASGKWVMLMTAMMKRGCTYMRGRSQVNVSRREFYTMDWKHDSFSFLKHLKQRF
jgi:hypothetical protein